MEKWQVVALLAAGLGLLLVAVLMRARFGDKYELKTVDLVLIIMPLLLVLLANGKLKVLDAFGVKADFSELFAKAAGKNIKQQVAASGSPGVDEVVRMLEMSAKGGVHEIPNLVEKKTEAQASGTVPKASCVTGSPRLPAFMNTMQRIRAEVIVRFRWRRRARVQASTAMAANKTTTISAAASPKASSRR